MFHFIGSKQRVHVTTKFRNFTFQLILIKLLLGNRGGCQSHDNRLFNLLLSLFHLFLHLSWQFFLTEVKFSHNSCIWMITTTVMALIKNNKWELFNVEIAPSQAVQKHLRNHHNDIWISHRFQHFLFIGEFWFDPFSSRHAYFISFFSVDAAHFVFDIFNFPVNFTLVLPEFWCNLFVDDDFLEIPLNRISLLFDQLDGIGQEDNLFLLSLFAQIVVHGGNRNQSLTLSCRQVNDPIFIQWTIEKNVLITVQVYLLFLKGFPHILLVFGSTFKWFDLFIRVIEKLVLLFFNLIITVLNDIVFEDARVCFLRWSGLNLLRLIPWEFLLDGIWLFISVKILSRLLVIVAFPGLVKILGRSLSTWIHL